MVVARLTEGSVEKHLWAMSLPMLLGLFASMSIQIVDIWFISKLGSAHLAAMGFIFPVVMLFLSLSIGLSAGASSVIARSLFYENKEAKENKQTSDTKQALLRLITDAQSLSFCLSLMVVVICCLITEPLFALLGAPPKLMPLISSYIYIYYFNGMFMMMGLSALASVRATGNTKVQAFAMLSGAMLNVILDPILIFGLFGAPRLELEGAAIAGVISRFFTMAIAYAALSGKLKLLTSPFVKFSLIWVSWKKLLHIAIPAMGTNVIIPISTGVITALLASYGEYAVAGMGVVGRLEPFMLMAFYALSAIMGPFVGQNLGAGKFDRIMLSVRKACQFSLLWGFLLTISLWFFAEFIVSCFTESSEVLAIAKDYLWIVPISYGSAGIVMVINASFNGIGKPLQATVISVMRVFILYIPMAYLGSILFEVRGIFMAYALVNIVCAVIGYWWFKKMISVENRDQKEY